MRTRLTAVALLFGFAAVASPQTPSAERDVLVELFNATGGPAWNRKAGWGSDAPICRWEGVVCGFYADSGPVTRLELWDNNLRGVVPPSLQQLAHLKVLQLSKNHLTGALPVDLVRRANDNLLALHYFGNALSELLTQLSIRRSSFTGVCASDDELQFAATIDGRAGTADYQSMHCGDPDLSDGESYCLKAERGAPRLDDVSRALQRLDFRSAGPEYHSPGGLSTHEEELRTAVVWGDGRSQVVSRSGGQAPIDVWQAQQLLLGLVPTDWQRKARRVSCDSLTWSRP